MDIPAGVSYYMGGSRGHGSQKGEADLHVGCVCGVVVSARRQ